MKRRWLYGFVLAAGLWLVMSQAAEVRQVAAALRGGRLSWLLVAVALQVVFQVLFAGIYHTAFLAVGVESRWWRQVPILCCSLAVNLVASGTGAALFVHDAARRGQSAARAAAATVLVRVVDFATFAAILLYGLVYLHRAHALTSYELWGAVGLGLVIAGWSALLVLGLFRPALLSRVLGGVMVTANRVARRLGRPEPLSEDWPARITSEYADAARSLAERPARGLWPTLVACLAHAVDLLTIAALFAAFEQPVAPGAVVAGFGIAVLFWIVAVTPQGAGVVEGAMSLAYVSMGVPAATATAVALAFRGLTFWFPALIGFVLLPRLFPTERREVRGLGRDWPVATAAALTALMGLINVASAVMPALTDRLDALQFYVPLEVRHGVRLTCALAGFALLALAQGLHRHKRMAHALVMLLLIVSVFTHLAKGLYSEETLLATGLLAYLVAVRHRFQARSDRPSVAQGVRALVAAFGFTLLYGVLGFYLLDHHFRVNFGLRAALRQTVVMFTQFYDPGLVPITPFGRYFADSIYLIGMVTGGFGLLMLLRPVLLRRTGTPAERRRARAILEAHARSSTARLALFDDKAYWFSPEECVIAYVVKGRIALALGDPVGPAAHLSAAIAGFRDYAARHDWQVAFYETHPELLDAYRAAGLQPLCIGHDALVDLAEFTLEGKAGKALRPPLNKLRKLGYRAAVADPPLSEELLQELREVSDAWLSEKHGNEKQFALGWFDDEYLRHGPVMLVRDPDGRLRAFANIIHAYQRNEASIDLMRHVADLEPGTMDFLFIELLSWAKETGYESFDLGLSALSGVGEKAADPAIERSLRFIYEHVNRFYSFKGLHHFKSKFHPRWEPRYLVHPGAASLPAVWTAIMRANGGDDFLSAYLRR